MKGYLKTGVAVLVFLLMAMTMTASAQTVSVDDVSLQVGDTGTVDVVLDQVPSDGLSFANVSVDISSSSVAEFTDVSFPSWATTKQNSTFPSSTMWFKVGDLSDNVQAGDTNVVLATLSVKGLADGSASTDVTLNTVQADDTYQEIKDQFSTSSGNVDVGVTPTPTPTPPPTCKDPLPKIASADNQLTMEFKDYKDKVNDCKLTYDYGDTVKVEVTYPADSDSTQWLEIRDRANDNNRLERYTLDSDGVDTVNIPSADYSPATNFGFHLYSSKDGVERTLDTVALGYTIEAEVVEPQISLTLDNPSNKIAKGDIAKFEGEITTTGYTWTLNGPYDKTSHFSDVASAATVSNDGTTIGTTSMEVTAYDHDIEVSIPTKAILDAGGSTGTYKFKVWNAAYPDTTASVEFKLEGVSVTPVADKDTIKKGEDLTVSGTTNIAETNSEYDNNAGGNQENQVFIAVYNTTSAEPEDFVAGYWDTVDEDGTFSKDITFELSWESDTTYEVDVIAMSNYDTTKPTGASADHDDNADWAGDFENLADYYDDESVYVEVEDPEVNFEMEDVTFTKGESDISFAGTTSLGSGEAVWIPADDIDFVDSATYTHRTSPAGEEALRILAGTDGTWESEDVDIKDDASIGSYTVHAKIYSPDGEELDDDSVNIKVVKQELDASIDKTTVAKGGEITINGSTSVSSVFIFASEKELFRQTITEDPTDTTYTVRSNDMEVPVDDDTFTKNLDVRTDADTGTYMLYVYAPSTTAEIETAEDPQKVFSLTISDVGFTEVPETVKMVQGSDKDLDFMVPETAEDDVYVEFTFRGSGIKIDADEYSSFRQTPDDDGLIELTLDPFWYDGPATERLESTYNLTPVYDAQGDQVNPQSDGDSEYSTLLPVGTYALEAELFYNNDDSIEEVKVPIQITQPTLSPEMPGEVSLGDELQITVQTNRDENYDEIYVVLDRGINPVAQQVNTDENGTAVASFETLGLGMGSYKIFVRDTMGTIGEDANIDEFYDWDPALEKTDWASDDMYTVKTVSVVQEAETPTPTPTKEVTETPTKEVTETPTKEVTETPTQAPTTPPTTEEPTPTQTEEQPTPGFEVVFAVAGLLAVAYLLRRR